MNFDVVIPASLLIYEWKKTTCYRLPSLIIWILGTELTDHLTSPQIIVSIDEYGLVHQNQRIQKQVANIQQ